LDRFFENYFLNHHLGDGAQVQGRVVEQWKAMATLPFDGQFVSPYQAGLIRSQLLRFNYRFSVRT
jgi:hypothetical protein